MFLGAFPESQWVHIAFAEPEIAHKILRSTLSEHMRRLDTKLVP